MTAELEPIKRLEFLIGRWRSRADNQFGEKGVIEGTLDCSHEPSEKFIAMVGESRSEGKLVNRGTACLMWDQNIRKYVRKSLYSYGWILNEVGSFDGSRLTFDVVSMDGEPDFFKGTRWRSFVHKYSDYEIGTGLEVAKQDGPFSLYGESKAKKVQKRS